MSNAEMSGRMSTHNLAGRNMIQGISCPQTPSYSPRDSEGNSTSEHAHKDREFLSITGNFRLQVFFFILNKISRPYCKTSEKRLRRSFVFQPQM